MNKIELKHVYSNIIKCIKGCCTLYVEEYKGKVPNKKEILDNNYQEKAGMFIYDPYSKKILLVKSRGRLWGPPKGGTEKDEKILDCAKREVKEETGLIISDDDIIIKININSRAVYYYVELKETDVKVQNHIIGNDANGIGWINKNCLYEMVTNGKILLNQHCRILIRRFLKLNINHVKNISDIKYSRF